MYVCMPYFLLPSVHLTHTKCVLPLKSNTRIYPMKTSANYSLKLPGGGAGGEEGREEEGEREEFDLLINFIDF